MENYYLWRPAPLPRRVSTHCDMKHLIQLIPQGTVDNNLGPDRIAGPKAKDPN